MQFLLSLLSFMLLPFLFLLSRLSFLPLLSFLSLLSFSPFLLLASASSEKDCLTLLAPPAPSFTRGQIQEKIQEQIQKQIQKRMRVAIERVTEFAHMKRVAEEMGIRVWSFGGTASSFVHYVRLDLMASAKETSRFDYDFTNIYRSTQDIDIVVDASPQRAREFQDRIAKKFPYFLGSKAKWEVRPLKHSLGTPGYVGFKEALLNDTDFSYQNTDTHSIGMISLMDGTITDVKYWGKKESLFLQDASRGEIRFLRNPRHFQSARAKIGENPEILGVLRFLVKAFQYELVISPQNWEVIQSIASEFNPSAVKNSTARRKIEESAKKLVLHAANLEYAIETLKKIGLRKKLIKMGNKEQKGSMAWWLDREPLPSFPVGKGRGKTAKELGVAIVTHDTSDFLPYESITRSYLDSPNVFISREGFVGETAAYGNGFYTQIGKQGAKNTGFPISFKVHPEAREGKDFIKEGGFLIFQNKRAFKVVFELLDWNLEDLVRIARGEQEINFENKALLEKLKRRLSGAKLVSQMEEYLQKKSTLR